MSRRNDMAVAARKRSGLACARKLDDAAKALSAYLRACNACGDGSGDEFRGASDCRHRLIGDISEYETFLHSKYDD